VCDLAETLWRRELEAEDMLRLLAGLAQAGDYETPAERITAALEEAGPADPAARRAEVAGFLLAAGGD
jgi:hypothetical protein